MWDLSTDYYYIEALFAVIVKESIVKDTTVRSVMICHGLTKHVV